MNNENSVQNCRERLIEIYKREAPPQCEDYLQLLEKVNNILDNEDEAIRPYDSFGLPGGIVYLKQTIPTIIIPDIHARLDFFLNVLLYENSNGYFNLQKLASDELQIVCVGDGFHAEGRAVERWVLAFEEYKKRYRKHKSMDEEMRESLGVMEMVMEVKSSFPVNFHFLKGNHENIANEEGEGNHPFRKFTYEGIMVLDYIERFYGQEFLDSYYSFEKKLPLLAVGKNFLVSHAEPREFFDRETLIEYREYPDAVEALTWTANDDAEADSVMEMLEYYLDMEGQAPSYYFGGHRPIRELYNPRADGKYIQIHNPNKFIIAFIREDKDINLDEDIIEIENKIDILLNEGREVD